MVFHLLAQYKGTAGPYVVIQQLLGEQRLRKTQVYWPGQENLPILVAALPKCTFWSEDISNALLEVIIFFLWAIDYHYV